MAQSSPSTRPLLTVAMIVRDAARLLPATLDSIRTISDQVVVLDTGSSDETRELAADQGADVFVTEWNDDFSAARNECATHVRGQWTLWIDAGETIDDLGASKLRHFVEKDAQPDKAYMLYVCKPSVGSTLPGEQIGKLRLIPTDANLQFQGRIRETVLPSAMEGGLEVDVLDCRIERPRSDADVEVRRSKAERNLFLADMEMADHGETPLLLIVRATALAELDQTEAAVETFRKAIQLAKHGSTEKLEAYYGLLTVWDRFPEQRQTQAQTCLEALEVFPLDAQLLCGMGCYLLHQQRLDLAARSYELAATHGQVDACLWHLADVGDVATSCLSLTQQLLGDLNRARTILEDALAQRPTWLRTRQQLIELYAKTGQRDEALAQVDQLPDDIPHRQALRKAVEGAALAAEGHPQEAQGFLTTAYEDGCRELICLRWLAMVYLKTGQWNDAETILTEWQERDPTSLEVPHLLQTLTRLRAGKSSSLGPKARPDGGREPVTPVGEGPQPFSPSRHASV